MIGGRLSTTQNSAPNEMACINLGQSVRSLEAGRVSSDEQPEVVACTYRGRVCSIKNQALRQVRIAACSIDLKKWRS